MPQLLHKGFGPVEAGQVLCPYCKGPADLLDGSTSVDLRPPYVKETLVEVKNIPMYGCKVRCPESNDSNGFGIRFVIVEGMKIPIEPPDVA